jgi:hypothetical protein
LRRPVPSHEKPQIVRSSKVRVPIHSDNRHPTTDSADRGLSIFADRDLSGLLEVSLRSCSPSAVALPDCIHRRLPLDNDGTGPAHVFGGAHTFPIFPFCKSGTGPATLTLSAGYSPGGDVTRLVDSASQAARSGPSAEEALHRKCCEF